MMEMIALSLVVLAVTLYFLLCVLGNRRDWPPSPRRLPVIGHLHLLGKLPHQSLHKLAEKYGGLMFLKLGSINTLVVSTAAAAKDFFNLHDQVFASRPNTNAAEYFGYKGAGLVWAKYGEHWRNMRKVCTLELLTSKRVELSSPVRRLEVSMLLKELLDMSKEQLPVDLTTKLSDVTFNTILRVTMGHSYSACDDPEEAAQAKHFKDVLIAGFTVSGTSVADFFPLLNMFDSQVAKMKAIKHSIDIYLDKEIVRHRERLTEEPRDFMDVILSLEGDVSLDSIKSLTLDMIAPAMDTSAVTVEWALAELIRRPELMQRAQAELKAVVGDNRTLEENDLPNLSYLKAVVKETLRLHPAAPLLIPHESMEPCKMGRFVIPAGTQAIINAYAIARDPAFWKEPLEFNPDRFLGDGINMDVKGQCYGFLPFSSGRRSCPGILLGMTTVQLLLGALLHAYDWSLPGGEPVHSLDMSESSGVTVPRASNLKLVPAARLNSEAYLALSGYVQSTN